MSSKKEKIMVDKKFTKMIGPELANQEFGSLSTREENSEFLNNLTDSQERSKGYIRKSIKTMFKQKVR